MISQRLFNLKKYLIVEFYYSVLRRDWRVSTFLQDILLKTVAYVVVSVDRFITNASAISASALTFYSTLSFIPVVALVLAIARGFGASKALEEWLNEQTFTNPEVMQWVMNLAGKALDNTQSNIIAGLGIVLLIWSVVKMLSSTELAMNRIWGVKKGRGVVTADRQAVEVHHIKHVDEYPELAYEDSNLVSLCQGCHNKAHPEKARAATYGHRY